MTPAQLLQLLRAALATWLQGRGGNLSIASDAWHALELLVNAGTGPRIVLRWDGDSQDADQDAGIVKHRLSVIVSAARGLAATPGQQLVDGTTSRPPLYAVVSAVRAVVRAIEYPAGLTSGALRYAGCQAATTPEGVPLDAYELHFEIDASLPLSQDPNP
jgi:hypothetical protein